MTRRILILSAFLLLPLGGGGAALAADCSQAAAQIARQTGGEVLSVSSSGENCEVTLRIPGEDGKPPRVVTRTVSG